MLEEKVMEQTQSEQAVGGVERPGEVKAVAILLYIYAGIAVIGLLSGNVAYLLGVIINLVLANGMMKMKFWAKTWTIIRSAAGILFALLLLGSLQEMSDEAIALFAILGLIDIICFTAIIIMLTIPKVRKANWN